MGKVLIGVGALATLAVGMLAADQATSRENQPYKPYSTYSERWMVGRNDDTTPCREAPTTGWDGGSHAGFVYALAESCRQEWRRAHNTYRIPDSYRGPSKTPSNRTR